MTSTRFVWPHIPGCLALGEWSHYVIIWAMKIFFVQFFCVFLPPLLNIFCFVRSIPFLSFIVSIFTWNVPLVSLIFLKRSLVFSILLFSSISLHWSLRKVFLSLLSILRNSAFKWEYLSFSPLLFTFLQLFVRSPQTTTLPFCFYFSWGWPWSLPSVQYYEPLSVVFQALCLSNLNGDESHF